MKKIMKRLLTGVLSLAAVFTTLPASQVQAAENQYWTDAQEKAGYIEQVMNDGNIGSTFHESIMQVEGETAYCIDINTAFESGYKARSDASSRMSTDQIADVALSLEYVKQYAASHNELNYKQVYLLEQCVVWQRLSVHLGWSCDNVRAGRSMNAAVYFVTQNSGDVDDEKMKNNIGLKFAFRSTDISEIKNTLEFFGVDNEDENNQKRLRDLENGQCLFQDLYGRVGVIQIHPVFADLFHAFDTRPPKQTEETR